MSELRSRKKKNLFLFIISGLLCGLIYAILNRGVSNLFALINATLIGLSIGLFAGIFELYYYPAKMRKFSFPVILVLRSVYYFFLIVATILLELIIARMIRYHMSFIEVLKSDEFQHFLMYEDFLIGILYASGLIILFNFTRLMYRKLGQRTLGDLITGKYVIPVKQNKIVMFLQIANTTTILSKLGRVRFNDFLNDFIFDITEPILAYRGEIYEYVDDQVIVLWNYKSGISNAGCIRAYFEAKDELLMKKEKYVHKYNVFPHIQAAYHAGPVIKGEIGVVKSTIKYSGDLMNTTSRLLEQCVQKGKELLIEKKLKDRISLPVIFEYEIVGSFVPKGKSQEIEFYSVIEKNFNKL
ncbi:MAG: adenylate/guanylate cyclase domain-containing protein [Cyclobacteriaceae bacterium]|nr:adenylate/guanylate cyclase domain-containing protein [Cyclobacteriaceae bacterium]